jgi:hypothetical protein
MNQTNWSAVNSTLFGSGGTPEGFWTLFVTSIGVVFGLALFLSWVANPKAVCKCCSNCWDCGRRWRNLRSGARRLFLASSTHNDDASESLAEDWWSPEQEEINRKDNNKGVHTPTGKLVNIAL